jgi:hypothetical protein
MVTHELNYILMLVYKFMLYKYENKNFVQLWNVQ